MSRIAQLFYAVGWPLALSALFIFMGAATRMWLFVVFGVVLLLVSLPWVVLAARTRVAAHAFAADGELYIDTGGEQLVLSSGDVTQIGVLASNALYATWMPGSPHLAIDIVHPTSGKKRRYVVALVDQLLLRQLRSQGFDVKSERIE